MEHPEHPVALILVGRSMVPVLPLNSVRLKLTTTGSVMSRPGQADSLTLVEPDMAQVCRKPSLMIPFLSVTGSSALHWPQHQSLSAREVPKFTEVQEDLIHLKKPNVVNPWFFVWRSCRLCLFVFQSASCNSSCWSHFHSRACWEQPPSLSAFMTRAKLLDLRSPWILVHMVFNPRGKFGKKNSKERRMNKLWNCMATQKCLS